MSDLQTKELSTSEEYSLLQRVGGQKFILSMVVVLLTTLLCWFSKIEPGIYSVVIVAVVGAFVAGDVIQSIQKSSK